MSSGQREEWQAFIAAPSTYALPASLAACFNGVLSQETCEKLLDVPRLEKRLSERLARFHRLPNFSETEAVGTEDQEIILASPEKLEQIILRAGAISFASSLAGTIVGSKAASMRAALGNELCAFALENRDLARRETVLDDRRDVREQVLDKGMACLRAWTETLPMAAATRLRLKVPELSREGPRETEERGPEIVRRAAR